LPDTELRAIVDLVRPRLVVGIEPARLPGCRVLPAGQAIDTSLSCDPLPERVAAHWKAMTSGGSTGRPKVIVDHNPGAWDPKLAAMRQQVDDTLLNPGPLYHNAPFSLMHAGLLTGGHVVEMGKFDPLQALELIERNAVGWVNFVPTMMHRIWRLPEQQRCRFDLSSLRIVYHMASACPVWLKQQWIEWLGPERIWELYGGTERQGACEIGGHEWLAHKGSVGRAQANCRAMILDEQGRECPPGEVGEIFFLPEGGQSSTYHYIGAEAKAVGEWESIGDLGYKDEEGYVYLVDRRTDLIVSGGVNVYPAEVEAVLDSHPDVQSSIVIGLPDEDLGHRVHALVQLNPSARQPIGAEELRAYLGQHLVRYKIPRTFEFVDRPLRDDAGKARRSALRDERIRQV
jgi:bile acid-coenzyme A ligase